MATQAELGRRRQAVQMYYYEQQTKAAICRDLNCTRPWLDRWLSRYDPDDVAGSLADRKRGPRQPATPWSAETRERVIAMRKARSNREQWPYALVGAQAIRYELEALGSHELPPVRTIHRWLVQEELVNPHQPPAEPRESRPIPLPAVDAVNVVHQLDLKGPFYLQGSAHKYYLAVLRDCYSRRCAIHVLDSRAAQGIVDFLVGSWQWMGLPQYLQLDNALEFRGSNLYPRSFGRIVRVALDLGIEPLFNPASEPWRNGRVEWFNGFLDQRFMSRFFRDVAHLEQEARDCQTACNATHRLSVLAGHTPDEICAQASLRLLPIDYQQHRRAKLPQDHGHVSFVRFVRKSGRITLGANDRFMVDPDLKYTYVRARVDLTPSTVTISQGDHVLQTYDYSPDTVGRWAGEEEPETDPDVVKERECNAIAGSAEH
jgi:putative transposase